MLVRVQGLINFLYHHHFVRYLFVGGTTFVIDFVLLYGLHGGLGVRIGVATTIAYWVSIAYNFLVNRTWTFSAREKTDLKRHIATYLALLACNYAFTLVFVFVLSHHINYLVAKALAVLIQMTWTYYIYKNYIFVTKEQ